MNKHQENLVGYLKEFSDYFIGSLSSSSEKFIYIQDVFPLICDFLSKSISRDMNNYVPRSAGYERLIDMLIELKNTKAESEFAITLLNVINGVKRPQS